MSTLKEISQSELAERLSSGIVTFAFKKVDGSLRLARGTRNLSLIPNSAQPKGSGNRGDKLNYFDLDLGWWRSISSTSETFCS